MSTVSADEILHSSVDDAIYALRRIGADPEPRFDITFEQPGFGKIRRVYGIFGNVLEKRGYVEEPVILDRLVTLVEDPDNKRIYEKLESGKMSYTPVNKRALRKIGDEILTHGVHLPWTWRPMNFDFAALANKVHRESPLPFIVFYSQQVMFNGSNANTSRIFSLPVEGNAQGTWAEPIYDELLDPDVGLIIEANARA
ncbi:MAG: hypothetical protein KC656_10295 [Myxococcales bacterium]|nr:hypothetical protein [Myxococcales bacterium]